MLDTVLDRITALSSVQGRGTLVVAAADHAVTAYGISAFDPTVTADVARATREGTSMGAVAARSARGVAGRGPVYRTSPLTVGPDKSSTATLTQTLSQRHTSAEHTTRVLFRILSSPRPSCRDEMSAKGALPLLRCHSASDDLPSQAPRVP